MEIKEITEIKTEDEARQEAIKYQSYVLENNLTYGEIAEFSGYFETLAKKFNLTEEFKENGIL